MVKTSFDLLVIGAGPGGYVAAIRAAQLGMNVACVEKEKALGGTCLRVGCIPSKALLDSSELYALARHAFETHGITVKGLALDVPTMLKRKDKVVKSLTTGIAGLFKKNNVTRLTGTASLLGNGQVKVTGEDAGIYAAKHIIIASGSAPIELPFMPFDGEYIVSSSEALSFASVPKRLIVVGGGVIGLELGSVWSRLGSEVLVVESLDRLLPGMDLEMARELQKILEKQGLKFKFGAKVQGAKVADGKVTVQIQAADGSSNNEQAERVLVAVGRKPFTQGLGLDRVGVALDERGRIQVDAHFKTSAAGIYAIGDVIAGPMLAHKAEEDGIACVELLAGQAGHVNYDLVPGVVYTWPELASLGLSQEAAAERGLKVNVGRFPFLANGRARAAEEKDGLVKIIAAADGDRVLGVHILGPRASDLIAEAVAVMEFGGSAEDIARTCHAHPTFAEAVKEAALDVGGRVIHK